MALRARWPSPHTRTWSIALRPPPPSPACRVACRQLSSLVVALRQMGRPSSGAALWALRTLAAGACASLMCILRQRRWGTSSLFFTRADGTAPAAGASARRPEAGRASKSSFK
mgnify:CR=1 FL=1